MLNCFRALFLSWSYHGLIKQRKTIAMLGASQGWNLYQIRWVGWVVVDVEVGQRIIRSIHGIIASYKLFMLGHERRNSDTTLNAAITPPEVGWHRYFAPSPLVASSEIHCTNFLLATVNSSLLQEENHLWIRSISTQYLPGSREVGCGIALPKPVTWKIHNVFWVILIIVRSSYARILTMLGRIKGLFTTPIVNPAHFKAEMSTG